MFVQSYRENGNTLHYIAQDFGLSQTCMLTRSFAFLCMACSYKVSELSTSAVFPRNMWCVVSATDNDCLQSEYLKWTIKAVVGAELVLKSSVLKSLDKSGCIPSLPLSVQSYFCHFGTNNVHKEIYVMILNDYILTSRVSVWKLCKHGVDLCCSFPSL